ncbi:hypothetical protein P154DRAFT_15874 [Amniculicola lignicola CBS 123094]|uniref:Uncharacterized protein n=1 Tax=Amniculicola lignicola CBS 123094 TaxID=1392246 RepID=A0A6A5X5B4_9PLEO|nr:hypothetical protein P154DRAFT_15874 [Amniculicola lignicola CBS 123094]
MPLGLLETCFIWQVWQRTASRPPGTGCLAISHPTMCRLPAAHAACIRPRLPLSICLDDIASRTAYVTCLLAPADSTWGDGVADMGQWYITAYNAEPQPLHHHLQTSKPRIPSTRYSVRITPSCFSYLFFSSVSISLPCSLLPRFRLWQLVPTFLNSPTGYAVPHGNQVPAPVPRRYP